MRTSLNASDIRLLMPVIYYYSPDLAATLYELAQIWQISTPSRYTRHGPSRAGASLAGTSLAYRSLLLAIGAAKLGASQILAGARRVSRVLDLDASIGGLTASQTDSAAISGRWSTPCYIVRRGAVAVPGQILAGVPEGRTPIGGRVAEALGFLTIITTALAARKRLPLRHQTLGNPRHEVLRSRCYELLSIHPHQLRRLSIRRPCTHRAKSPCC